jgi:hypothetical protein
MLSILKQKIRLQPISLWLLAFIVSLSVVSSLPFNVSASAAAGFIPGKIIDDGVFINSTSMNQAQIQSFLNSKVPICDTYGSQPSEYGGGTRAQWASSKYGQTVFTCLKDYIENNKPASQIIAEASKEFNINPQVLLVLLQKEQGLVTDTWPLDIQYRSATGYGCPDTAPCDTQYYGLTNQVRWAARMFRAIMNNSPTWYTPYVLGNNYIQYSPVASCGGSVVNIQNRSTQALYNYTPYQPNQAALNAGWGTAGCGAYGNRNFYLYFTQWFGSTIKAPLPECPSPDFECVWGFKNDLNGKYFYTANRDERNSVYQMNYSSVGIVFYARKSTTVGAAPVYRLYSTDGSHLWTPNQSERNSLLSTGSWSDEGVGFYQDPISSNTGYATHRLYNKVGQGIHILSADQTEIQKLISYGYIDEGTVFTTPTLSYPENPAPPGKEYVYRILLPNKHFWTTSIAERDSLLKVGGVYEGIAWQTSKSNGTPVYRLYSPSGEHFWTTSATERDSIIKFGWRYEGISWNTESSGQPIYRLYNKITGRHLWTPSSNEKSQLLTYIDWVDEGIAWNY